KGTIAYATAKAGVIQLTKSLALELSFKGVRVNAIAPGFIMTELSRQYLEANGAKMAREIPAGRIGVERDFDGALLLLVSPAGSYMAGANLVVDGGHTLALGGTRRLSRPACREAKMRDLSTPLAPPRSP